MKLKIRNIFRRKRGNNLVDPKPQVGMFTRVQLENAYRLGYNDGKRDGLTIAREQATKSLKEILWQQQKTTPK